MIDGVGSAKFRRSKTRKSLMEAGVYVQTSLKVNIVRMWFQRVDLRNHRKIVVIDEKIAYTGSQNMVDPRYFKQDEDVGQWIDTMIKLKFMLKPETVVMVHQVLEEKNMSNTVGLMVETAVRVHPVIKNKIL